MARDDKTDKPRTPPPTATPIPTPAPTPLPDVEEHELVKDLEIDAESHIHLVTLTGYPGKSTDDNNFRLYLDRHFQSYYEIPREHFVQQWASDADDPHAPNHVAIKGIATPRLVVHTTISSGAAGFLKGELVSTLIKDAIAAASGVQVFDHTPPPPPPGHGRPITLRHRPEGGGYDE